MVSRWRSRLRVRAAGYNLVALMVLVAVINITVAAALPSVSQAMRREREAELIFRGLQYAEAIRVFQLRNGRYPQSLRELLEINPRCIRQLWTDPFNDDGEWGLVLAQGAAGSGRQVGTDTPTPGAPTRRTRVDRRSTTPQEVQPRENVTERGRVPRRGQVVSRGPIIGVKSLSNDDAIRSFMGAEKYSDWLFTVDLIPTLEVPAIGENVPRLHTLWVGKPFPEGVEGVQPGALPSTEQRNPLDRQRGLDRLQRRDQRRTPQRERDNSG